MVEGIKYQRKIYSIMKPQILHDITPKEIEQYSLEKYVMGSSMIKAQEKVTLDHFDQIQKIRHSTCPKKGGEFIHAIGWRALENQYTLLILKKKPNLLSEQDSMKIQESFLTPNSDWNKNLNERFDDSIVTIEDHKGIEFITNKGRFFTTKQYEFQWGDYELYKEFLRISTNLIPKKKESFTMKVDLNTGAVDLFSLGLHEYSQEEINEYTNQINWHE